MADQYISIREAAQALNVSEKAVLDLVENQKLKAYKIADKFLRLKRSEVMDMARSRQFVSDEAPLQYTFFERITDFFYFNDFYLVALGIIVVLLYVILAG